VSTAIYFLVAALASAGTDVTMSPLSLAGWGLALIAATAFVLFKIFNEVWAPFERRMVAERENTLSAAKEQARVLIDEHGSATNAHLAELSKHFVPRGELTGMFEQIRNEIVRVNENVVYRDGERTKEIAGVQARIKESADAVSSHVSTQIANLTEVVTAAMKGGRRADDR